MNIFITGITGTLGQAFTDHLGRNYQISGIDHNEERVAALRQTYPNIEVKLGDFGDHELGADIDLVIHLAAFKHVNLCETAPSACIANNVIKTYSLFRSAQRNRIAILFMSTDKAVEPCSVYGYSKALMEKMALELGGAVARSGNILASNGSVLSIWEQQIAEGKPLTLTHRDMRRYFISPEHLAERIWEKYLNGEKTIIPAMDRDVTLLELADETLCQFGLSVDTYPVEYTGLRPGEKLRERLV